MLILVSVIAPTVIISFSCLSKRTTVLTETKPHNIILFIGDGMGLAQVTAAISTAGAPLHIESMPVTGFSKTSSSDNYITDSAAGGTAISTGVKTRNGLIALAPDSSRIETIIEIAERNGLSTGVLSTSSVTHATPASFVAHSVSRKNYEEIAEYFTRGIVDVFMGGGLANFNNRSDSVNLIDRLMAAGYQVVTSPETLGSITGGRLAGLFYDEHMPKRSEGRSVSLAEMTRKAIDLLSSNEKGFFLMVEGSMIDWGCHDNDTGYMLSELNDMDEAVGEALAFASQKGNTLIIITADHETGGMTLTGGSLTERSVEASFSTEKHTAVMVPVFAFGPYSEKFTGIMENTELFEKMLFALNIR